MGVGGFWAKTKAALVAARERWAFLIEEPAGWGPAGSLRAGLQVLVCLLSSSEEAAGKVQIRGGRPHMAERGGAEEGG